MVKNLAGLKEQFKDAPRELGPASDANYQVVGMTCFACNTAPTKGTEEIHREVHRAGYEHSRAVA